MSSQLEVVEGRNVVMKIRLTSADRPQICTLGTSSFVGPVMFNERIKALGVASCGAGSGFARLLTGVRCSPLKAESLSLLRCCFPDFALAFLAAMMSTYMTKDTHAHVAENLSSKRLLVQLSRGKHRVHVSYTNAATTLLAKLFGFVHKAD